MVCTYDSKVTKFRCGTKILISSALKWLMVEERYPVELVLMWA